MKIPDELFWDLLGTMEAMSYWHEKDGQIDDSWWESLGELIERLRLLKDGK